MRNILKSPRLTALPRRVLERTMLWVEPEQFGLRPDVGNPDPFEDGCVPAVCVEGPATRYTDEEIATLAQFSRHMTANEIYWKAQPLSFNFFHVAKRDGQWEARQQRAGEVEIVRNADLDTALKTIANLTADDILTHEALDGFAEGFDSMVDDVLVAGTDRLRIGPGIEDLVDDLHKAQAAMLAFGKALPGGLKGLREPIGVDHLDGNPKAVAAAIADLIEQCAPGGEIDDADGLKTAFLDRLRQAYAETSHPLHAWTIAVQHVDPMIDEMAYSIRATAPAL